MHLSLPIYDSFMHHFTLFYSLPSFKKFINSFKTVLEDEKSETIFSVQNGMSEVDDLENGHGNILLTKVNPSNFSNQSDCKAPVKDCLTV